MKGLNSRAIKLSDYYIAMATQVTKLINPIEKIKGVSISPAEEQ